jgi:DNA-binding transcriptional MocR family regulator
MRGEIVAEQGSFEQIPHWVMEKATGRALALYLTLRRHARGSNRCAPSRAVLAAEMGVSTDTIDRAMKRLVEIGAITSTRRIQPNGDPAPNLYTIRWDPPGGSRKPAARRPHKSGLGSRKDAALRHTEPQTEEAATRFAVCRFCCERHDVGPCPQ